MPDETLSPSPVSPHSAPGPYRRADFARLPAEPRCELLYGRFYLAPSPTLRHQVVALLLWQRLDRIARTTGGLAVAAPLDTHLADHTTVQPDVLYVTRERTAIARERIEGAPDLVVEVLSPGTARRDRGEKLRAYAESGVREYWLVDPGARQIDFLLNHDGAFVFTFALDGRYRSRAFSEIELDLAELWAEADARVPG